MPFGFPKKPGKPSATGLAKGFAKKATVYNPTTIAVIISGATIIALVLLLITPLLVLGKASTDPGFAAQVGLDGFFGNTPQTTIAPPPPPTGGGTPPPTNNPGTHFYCQYDRSWTPTRGNCDIRHLGCGPTSIAMILTSFGTTYTPLQVAQINNIGCTGSTSFTQANDVINNWVKPKGYSVINVGTSNGSMNTKTIAKLTNEKGYMIFAGACTWVPGNSKLGHAFVITGVNSDGTLKILDPTFKTPRASCTSDTDYGPRTMDPAYPGKDIFANCPGRTGSFSGWGFLYALKKS